MQPVPPELTELTDWLIEVVQPLVGQSWQVTLNGNGGVIEAELKTLQSDSTNERGHRMRISRVMTAKFIVGKSSTRRTVFRTD